MAELKRRKPAWWFYPGWVVGSILSFPIAWLISVLALIQISRTVGDTIELGGNTRLTQDFFLSFIFFPLLGLLTGLVQYLLLRSCLPRMGWWVAVTTLGWTMPVVLFQYAFNINSPEMASESSGTFILAFALMGGLMGLFQWPVLRRQVRQTGWWILGSAAGWLLAGLIVTGSASSSAEILALILLPPLFGSIALWALLDWLPRRTPGKG